MSDWSLIGVESLGLVRRCKGLGGREGALLPRHAVNTSVCARRPRPCGRTAWEAAPPPVLRLAGSFPLLGHGELMEVAHIKATCGGVESDAEWCSWLKELLEPAFVVGVVFLF